MTRVLLRLEDVVFPGLSVRSAAVPHAPDVVEESPFGSLEDVDGLYFFLKYTFLKKGRGIFHGFFGMLRPASSAFCAVKFQSLT